MKKYIYFLLIMIIEVSCCQYRLEFDRTQKSVRTCDPNQIIENITIFDLESHGIVFEIYLEEENKGKSVIDLEKENEGYKSFVSNPLFKPNKKYLIFSSHLDCNAKIILYTNQYAEIDSVINNFSCEK